MDNFTQKWAIISLLEKVGERAEFSALNTPLHVTISGIFAIDKDEEWLASQLQNLLTSQKSVRITASGEAFFGPLRNVPVTTLRLTDELVNLHYKVHDWLLKSGATYNEPQYQGDGFLPHCTIQGTKSLSTKEERVLSSLSLVDLYPNNDGLQRRISITVYFQ